MSEMSEIPDKVRVVAEGAPFPEDVWYEAKHAMARMGWHANSMIIGAANAILAERERAAKIADGFAMLAEQKFSTAAKCGDGWAGVTQSARLATSESIASSIRSPDTMGDRSKI